MSKKNVSSLAAFILVSSLLLSGCGGAAAEGEYFGKMEPPEGQVLRYISGSEPESLDPQRSSGQPEARVHMALYDGLVEYHPKTMEPIPAIAESRGEIDEDASEYVFRLRKNARFSNGDPITAHDFVYTMRRGLAPELASRVAYLAYEIKYAQGYNEAGSFVRDPKTGRFVRASEAEAPKEGEGAAAAPAAPVDVEANHKSELARRGESAAPDTEFHKFIHEPARLVVPSDEADRQKAFKANPKLKALVEGKEFVPVRAEDIGVEAVDDYTVRITLERPAPYFEGLLAHQFFRIVPRKAIEQYGNDWVKPGRFIGSGAFMLAEHKPYNQIVVTRNPYYWDAAAVKLDKIVFYPLEEQTTMLNLYKTGEVDAVYNHTVPSSWLKAGVKKMRDYMDAPENTSEFYNINITKPPMNDLRVRRAFQMAVDREGLASFKVTSKPAPTLVPGIFLKYPRPKGSGFDPEAAKKLLAEAGYRDASGKYDPKKFPAADIEINYNTNESNRQTAEFVQAQWKQHLGITVALRNVEWKTYLDMRSKREYKGFARAGWVGDYMDPYTYLGIFTTCEGGDNGTGWCDPKFNKMLQDANSEPDEQKRLQMLANAEAYFLEQQPVITLMIPATNWMKKPYVKGLYPNPGTLHAWKYVYIEHDRAKWDRQMPDMSTAELAEK